MNTKNLFKNAYGQDVSSQNAEYIADWLKSQLRSTEGGKGVKQTKVEL